MSYTNRDFELNLQTGIIKELQARGLLTEVQMHKCIAKLADSAGKPYEQNTEGDWQNASSSRILQDIH